MVVGVLMLAAMTCSGEQAAALLAGSPQALLPCASMERPEEIAWAGHALRALGQPAEAVKVFSAAKARTTAQSPLWRALLLSEGEALLAAGDPAAALERLEGEAWATGDPRLPLLDRPFEVRLYTTVIEAALLVGKPEVAAAAAGKMERTPGKPTLALLRTARANKDATGEARWLADLYLYEFPDAGSPAAAEIAAFRPTDRQRQERWERGLKMGRADQVAGECLKWQPGLPAPTTEPERRLAWVCGEAFHARHEDAQASGWLSAALFDAATGKPVVDFARDETLVNAVARSGDLRRLADVCRRLQTGMTLAAGCRCSYLLALSRMKEEAPDTKGRALLEFATYAFARYDDNQDAWDAAWWVVLQHVRARSWAKARALLDRLSDQAGRDFGRRNGASASVTRERVARIEYWKGRVAAADGRTPEGAREAAAHWQTVLKKAPSGYWGLLAANRLGLATKVAARGTCLDPTPPALPDDDPEAITLRRAGFAELAASVSGARLVTRPDLAEASAYYFDGWNSLVRVGERLDAVRFDVPPKDRDATRAARWAWPRAYPKALAGTRTSLDPCLVLAVARAESRFEPQAVGPLGARGLMLLRPVTVARLAKGDGVPPPADAELDRPDTNLRWGVRYLERLQRRFGHPAAAVAGFEAGSTTAQSWVSALGNDLDLFVDSIPEDEARDYVREVLGGWAAYHRLYADGQWPRLEMTLPAPAGKGVDD